MPRPALPRIAIHVADDKLTREEELFSRAICVVMARCMRVERLIGGRPDWVLRPDQVHGIAVELREFAKVYLPDIDVQIDVVEPMEEPPKGARG